MFLSVGIKLSQNNLSQLVRDIRRGRQVRSVPAKLTLNIPARRLNSEQRTAYQVTLKVSPVCQIVLAVGLVIFGATTSRFSTTSGTNGAARAQTRRDESVTIFVNNMVVVVVCSVED